MSAKKIKVSNPNKQLDNLRIGTKYKLKDRGVNFYEIRDLTPKFAFDYLDLNEKDLSFNSKSLQVKDFIGLLNGLKSISSKTYDELSRIKNYRFHKIDFEKDNLSINVRNFKNAITNRPDELLEEEMPTLYQFDLNYQQKARAFGFLYFGVFYLIWFDKDHTIYKK